MAYTEYLDRRNSQSLLSSQRTQVVLREDVGLDDANPLWQSPGLQLAYLCTFRESLSDVRWSLLVRGDEPRHDRREGRRVHRAQGSREVHEARPRGLRPPRLIRGRDRACGFSPSSRNRLRSGINATTP